MNITENYVELYDEKCEFCNSNDCEALVALDENTLQSTKVVDLKPVCFSCLEAINLFWDSADCLRCGDKVYTDLENAIFDLRQNGFCDYCNHVIEKEMRR